MPARSRRREVDRKAQTLLVDVAECVQSVRREAASDKAQAPLACMAAPAAFANQVYEADCISGMRDRLPEKSIDIIVTSPPYNIGINYGKHDDTMPFNEYLEWMEEFGGLCRRVLKDDGSLYFNIGDKVSDEFRSFRVAQKIAGKLILQNTLHWIKSIAIPEHGVNIGHFKPVNSKRYINNCHEYIFHFTKSGKVPINKTAIGVPYADKSNIERWNHNNGDRRDRGNQWFIPYDTVVSKKDHPAAFPERLPEMCIRLSGFDRSTIVLDPFLGSGTTCVAATKLGCQYVGFEIDPEYIKTSREKLIRGV
ncbi:MAG: site-specific DNA-methyltransferase [Thaumarchaeota archaeon]|nr:site-specific DNA-methyltransferase [Nitrososphaerota archaeon]